MDVASGGHISHGHPATQTGQRYQIFSYGVAQDERLDYQGAYKLAEKHKPKLVIAGGSAYPRAIDFSRMREIADVAGAFLMVDMAHFAGLVATGLYPDPFEYADVVTTTTYKSLRGARGGIILTNNDRIAKKIAGSVFPGVQGSVLLHAVAGKAACLGEALRPEFAVYNRRVLDNANALAACLSNLGIRIVSGGTDSGLMLVDLRSKGVSGVDAVKSLEAAGLTCNKNLIPFDPESAEIASGLRLSANAGTTRGFGVDEFSKIGCWIAEVLQGLATDPIGNSASERRVRNEVHGLCRSFPIYR